ncbi:MAG: sensor histidine kinase [Firmicutes bacterium]|nr:sensor histidine kinase [Bacillota bacterium]
MALTNSLPPLPDAGEIERILRLTLDALQEGRQQIAGLVERLEADYERARNTLEQVKQQALRCIEEVDELEAKSRVARFDLFRVSRDYQRYGEHDVRRAYEEAERLQILLGEARERERFLRERRNELERTVAHLAELLEKAQGIEANMRAAEEVLAGNYSGVARSVSEWQARYEVGRRVIAAQEEERRRLARELHDSTAQGLASIAVELELSERMMDAGTDSVRRQMARLRSLVKETLTELRHVIFDLRPMVLDELGLVSAVRRYADYISTLGGPPVEVVVHGVERRFDPPLEVAAFRVVQEAVANARRHGAPSRIAVHLEIGDSFLQLTVKDDGRGFEPEEAYRRARERGSIGLISMEERVKLFGGRFSIQSAPGMGTRVSARFPLPEWPADSRPGATRAS